MPRTLAGLLAMLSLLTGPVHGAVETRTSTFGYAAGSGLLVKEAVEPDTSDLCLVTTYTLDAYGNRTSVTTRNCNGSAGEAAAPTGDAVIAPRTTTDTYDSRGQYATATGNALGHGETRGYDGRTGAQVSLTGPNGLSTTWTVDGFGRKTRETRADGTATDWEYAYCQGINGGSLACPTVEGIAAAYRIKTTPSAGTGPISQTYYDALGRALRSETESDDGTWIRQDTGYDALGRVARSSRPYRAGDAVYWATVTYDPLGRVVQETAPDGATTTTTYNGLHVSVTNARNQTRTTVKNSQGQIIQVTDALNQTVTYAHDPFGNLTRTTDPQGHVVSLSYDRRGRKTAMQDPDMGNWSYAYDALGQLVRQTDAKGQVSTLAYDKLGRLIQRTENDLISKWYYDAYKGGGTCAKGIGKLCQSEADNGYNQVHAYDNLGRPTSTTTTLDTTYVLAVAYDGLGRVARQSWPSGLAVDYVYSAQGRLKELRDHASAALYWRADSLDAAGHLIGQTYGNGIATQQTYDPASGRLTGIRAGAGNGVQDFTYQYDSLGNLVSRTDGNQALSETFAYDALNRLTSSTVNSGAGLLAKSYAYDGLGNIASRSDLGNYSYGAQPHALARLDYPDGSRRDYQYDANGNQSTAKHYDTWGFYVAGKSRTQYYTSYNMPTSIGRSGQSAAFYYGPEHQRVKQVAVVNYLTTTTYYLNPGNNGELLYEKDVKWDGSNEERHYLTAYGQVVAVIKRSGYTWGTKTWSTRYLHRDRLGSTTAVTDETGAVVERLAYEPFGKRRYASGADDPNGTLTGETTDRGFTNHEHLDQVGLIHMNGRLYDPETGRFTSADPYIQDPFDLQSYNRYSYAFNNPLYGTDPSGYCFLGCFWKKPIFRAILSVGVAVMTGIWVGDAVTWSLAATSANAATIGALTGSVPSYVQKRFRVEEAGW